MVAAGSDPLRVSFRRTGGLFAGNVLDTSVSAVDLDDQSRQTLESHLERADVQTLAARSPLIGTGADTYQYDILVEHKGRRSHVVVAQTAIPDSLRPLVEWLEQRAVRQRRSHQSQ